MCLGVSSLDSCALARTVQLQKMYRPTVWSGDRSTFYKSWSTTLYYRNEAYVCGAVGMEINKEKAFEIWHRRPALDLVAPMKAAMQSPTMKTVKKEAMKTAVKKGVGDQAAMKSPTMKTVKKAAMKTAVKKGVDEPKKTAMKSPAMKTVKKAAMQTAMKKAI